MRTYKVGDRVIPNVHHPDYGELWRKWFPPGRVITVGAVQQGVLRETGPRDYAIPTSYVLSAKSFYWKEFYGKVAKR